MAAELNLEDAIKGMEKELKIKKGDKSNTTTNKDKPAEVEDILDGLFEEFSDSLKEMNCHVPPPSPKKKEEEEEQQQTTQEQQQFQMPQQYLKYKEQQQMGRKDLQDLVVQRMTEKKEKQQKESPTASSWSLPWRKSVETLEEEKKRQLEILQRQVAMDENLRKELIGEIDEIGDIADDVTGALEVQKERQLAILKRHVAADKQLQQELVGQHIGELTKDSKTKEEWLKTYDLEQEEIRLNNLKHEIEDDQWEVEIISPKILKGEKTKPSVLELIKQKGVELKNLKLTPLETNEGDSLQDEKQRKIALLQEELVKIDPELQVVAHQSEFRESRFPTIRPSSQLRKEKERAEAILKLNLRSIDPDLEEKSKLQVVTQGLLTQQNKLNQPKNVNDENATKHDYGPSKLDQERSTGLFSKIKQKAATSPKHSPLSKGI